MSNYQSMDDRPAREQQAAGAFTAQGRPERSKAPAHLQSNSSNSTATLASTKPESYSYGKDSPNPDEASDMPILKSYQQQRPGTSTGGPSVSFGQDLPRSSNIHRQDSQGADVRRKKSLVRPDRERVDPGHRLWNYRNHAAAMEFDGNGMVGPSATGNYPQAGIGLETPDHAQAYHALGRESASAPARPAQLRRGKSILAREEDIGLDSGQAILRRGGTMRREKGIVGRTEELEQMPPQKKGPPGPWVIYYKTITAIFPSALLKKMGLKTKERQSAWREKVALLSIICLLMGAVGFLTFGFTQAVCGAQATRYRTGTVPAGSMIFHGYDYSMDQFEHPGAAGIQENSNPLFSEFEAGGMDGSFLFQKVNQNCYGIITPAATSGIPSEGLRMGWYFPCNMYNQFGTSTQNQTGYATGELCHTSNTARQQFSDTADSRTLGMKREGPVYYLWDDLKNASRNLAVYQSSVLDFDLLNWLDSSQVNIPPFFTQLANGDDTYRGRDITMQVVRDKQTDLIDCLDDIIRVGFVDSKTVGCIAADIVLYISLVFIIGVVSIKWALAVGFGWFLSWRIGGYPKETHEQRRARSLEIENWTSDIYKPAPARYRPNARKSMLPTKSRFSVAPATKQHTAKQPSSNRLSSYAPLSSRAGSGPPSTAPSSVKFLGSGMKNSPPGSPIGFDADSRNSSSARLSSPVGKDSRSTSLSDLAGNPCPWPLHHTIPQPPPDFEPFNFPLTHNILLVTAYSESVEGLRTTLDSLATTDYPNSHKVILVIADGIVKGSGNELSTPDIVLTMMKEFIIPPDEVQANSYVAIADGHKRHNLARVYAGFYSYDDGTVEASKQQRVPMLLVAKVGNPLEAHDGKPGNRGKRDSQVLLMSFLQKVMFDERMTTFDYEFFNSWWRCTGVSPDNYQICLMVDADTKVFPDSLSRMTACMVRDPEIMGLCGETKIANKAETWVTMIQVFEYYISHHLTKAFEATFGGVTCLPGCFSAYRVKSPKGRDDYWVPILANPDIVAHYSENVVDTLHKKNLLLLGEDRYLTTLLLKTFPRRKNMFCPQAVCKTVVPDTFRVLLSQRRRWINSTIHNLFELVLVRDLCGTFCFSMQFVVFMELVGTLVLPAAIAFTLYLIIVTIIPGTVKPIIPLILLAIILGLPGCLIVLTSRRLAYVGWMFIYLLSLPIWNFVLPAYAYFHMDDFSWGQTRKIIGDQDKGNHGDKEGEFDSKHIVMKRWGEFERERRWKLNNFGHSREPTYENVAREAPKPYESHRLSGGSSSETAYSNHGYSQDQHAVLRDPASQPLHPQQYSGPFSDTATSTYTKHSVTQLELPAPLAAAAPRPSYDSYTPPDHTPYGSEEDTRNAFTSSPSLSESSSSRGRFTVPQRTPEEQNLLFDGSIDDSRRDTPPNDTQLPRDRSSIASRFGGVSLRDDGPVAASSGNFLPVQRTRRQSQISPQPPASAPSPQTESLPPGARR